MDDDALVIAMLAMILSEVSDGWVGTVWMVIATLFVVTVLARSIVDRVASRLGDDE